MRYTETSDLLFVAAFLLTGTSYLIHTVAHLRESHGQPGADSDPFIGMIVAAGYAGWVAMLFLDPVRYNIPEIATFSGGIAGAGGISLMVAAERARRGGYRSDTLVTTGVYRWMRHPMYAGIILMHIGFPLFFRAVVTLISAAFWIPLIFIWRSWEEAELEEQFGDAYREYREEVRWF
ncbi:MAG: isoprenylcysteine carboxylmethyltransferase family protein [Methanomicrobiaceae archaeon]|nr:isoprenylcysteine carboxylmethyltransferase family protein [Methanomicrobiaceae archaeon]